METVGEERNIFHCRHNKFAFGDKFLLMGNICPFKRNEKRKQNGIT